MRCLLFLLLGSLSGLSAKLPEGYENLILGRNVSPEVESAAAHLADFLEKDFGNRPNLRRIPLAGRPSGIVIKTDPDNGQFDTDPLTDEILIERTANGIQILGSDNSSTCFAIYRFIEQCLGWRYFAPGDLGLEKLDRIGADVQHHPTWLDAIGLNDLVRRIGRERISNNAIAW